MFRATGQVADYELVRVIGHCRGRAGVVCMGIDRRTKHRVAVKVISPRPGEDVQTLAAAESHGIELQQMLARRSSAVPAVHGCGIENGIFYAAMEYVTGEDLDHYIGGGMRLPPARAAVLIRQVCACLAIAHAAQFVIAGTRRSIVHGDLKPENIRVTPRGTIKLLDFGNATSLPISGTEARTRWLTKEYASPERLAHGELGIHTDLWAIGVMLYEAIAGLRPGEQDCAMPRSGCSLPDSCPGSLARIAAKALRHEIEDRYTSAEAMLADLDAFLIGHDRGRDTALGTVRFLDCYERRIG